MPLQCALVRGETTNFEGVDVVPLITQKLVFAIWGLCWYNYFLGSIEVSQALKSTQLRGQWDDIEAWLSHEKGEKWHRKYEVTWHETVARSLKWPKN